MFEIEEPDLLTVIEQKLLHLIESGELEQFNKRNQEEMMKNATNPKAIAGITKASVSSVRKFDPTVLLDDDIIVDQKVLYPKGTKINPLEYTDFQKLVFIDGSDEMQAQFARDVASKDINTTIILVNGKPGLHVIDDKEYFYYFDQAGVYTTRFTITNVPSVVFLDGKEKVLTIQEVYLQQDKEKK